MYEYKCVRIMGGMGNQLFQYAFSKMMERKWGFHVVLDVSSYKKDELRKYELDKYDIDIPTADFWKSAFFTVNALMDMHGLPSYRLCRSRNAFTYLEYEKIKRCKFFVGFFQNIRYINGIKEELSTNLRYKGEISNIQKAKIKEVESVDSVGMHIRRGDYLHLTGYNIISMEYYQQAMEYFKRRFQNVKFYVFSDDIERCKKELIREKDIDFIDEQYSSNAVLQFELMRHCHHFIIGNSTYSWWASYLSEFDDKICIAPRNWFNDESANVECRNALLNGYKIL